jgi:CRISPR/Cas system endoribonuclease Cas6 (RAMP superfamily)
LRFDLSALRPISPIDRRSSRHTGKATIEPFLGSVLLEGDLAPFLPLLALGETCGIGSRTALGFGRFRLTVLA